MDKNKHFFKNEKYRNANLPADKYQELAGAVNDVFENKRFNRAQRRRLARNWRKYGKREEK